MGRFFAWLRRLLTPAALEPPTPPPPPPAQSHLDTAALAAVAAINVARQDYGLPPYAPEDRLAHAAQSHALDMATHRRLSHTGSDGGSVATRVADQVYRWSGLGETIGQGYPTAAAAVAGWMASPAHRAILLGPYAQVGTAVALDAAGTPYWCAVVATPA